MVRGTGRAAPAQDAPITKSGEMLSQTEVNNLLDDKRELESTIKEIQDSGGSTRAGAVDIATIQRKIRNIDNAIADRMPEEVGGVRKDSLIREERAIEDALTDGMPTRYEMDHPARCPGAVRKHLAWLNRNNPKITRYVQIQKILRPEEPKSVEALRREK